MVSVARGLLASRPASVHLSHPGSARGTVHRSTKIAVTEQEPTCSRQLARFFPGAVAIRTPVQVVAVRGGSARLRERTVVEFGCRDHAIFLSTLPLEFDDHVRIEHETSGDAAEGTVIAVQYHEGRKAVAVRLQHGAGQWVSKA